MAETTDPVIALSDEQCWERLRTQELGRLVTRVGDVLDIFPVNYVVDDGSVLFRTAQGSKLFELTVNDEVLFEVAEDQLLETARVCAQAMRHAYELEVPLTVGVEAGKTWADLEPVAVE